MRYIYNRDQFKINEQLFDSDNMNVEFGDTLLGGTLHRLLGIGRSALSNVQIQNYVNKLDRVLASMVVQPTLDEVNDTREEGEEITIEELSEEGKKAETSKLLLKAAELSLEDDEESKRKAVKLLEAVPEEVVKELPAAASEALVQLKTDLQVAEKEQEEEQEEDQEETQEEGLVKYQTSDIVLYNGSLVEIVDIDNENNKIKIKDREGNISEEDLTNDSINNNKEDIAKYLVNVINETKGELEASNLYKEAEKKNKEELDNYITNMEQSVKSLRDGKNINESITRVLAISKKIKSKISNYTGKANESYFIDIDLILEKQGKEEKVFTEKDFKKLKKEIEKESKTWKFTMSDLEELNKKVAETKGIGEITGEQAKAIMDVLTSAKDSLLHTKPHEEIRKKQQRYFDKLPSGRAINRKGYLKWVKEVNKILSYYKDFLPKKVIKMISDSLDKDAISNDYVKINKDFLDIDKKGSSSDSNSSKKEEKVKKSSDKASGFVGVNRIVELKSRFTLMMNIDSGGSKETITFVNVAKKGSDLFFKFTIGANLKWLENYYKGKNLKNTVEPANDMPFDTNGDMQDFKFSTNAKYGDVFFAKAKNVDTIKKGGKLNIIYFNLSELVKNNMSEVGDTVEFNLSDIETKESSWSVNTLGILVGDTDFGYSEPTSGSNIKDIDAQITNKIASEFAKVLKKDIADLKVGDKIVYRQKTGDKGTNEAEIAEFITDTLIRVKTSNSDDVKIDADQIIL